MTSEYSRDGACGIEESFYYLWTAVKVSVCSLSVNGVAIFSDSAGSRKCKRKASTFYFNQQNCWLESLSLFYRQSKEGTS